MTIPEAVELILKEGGHTQTWAANRMNELWPGLNMSAVKLNATLRGRRKMTSPEFLAFCKATGTNPADFLDKVAG